LALRRRGEDEEDGRGSGEEENGNRGGWGEDFERTERNEEDGNVALRREK